MFKASSIAWKRFIRSWIVVGFPLLVLFSLQAWDAKKGVDYWENIVSTETSRISNNNGLTVEVFNKSNKVLLNAFALKSNSSDRLFWYSAATTILLLLPLIGWIFGGVIVWVWSDKRKE